jgi:hypothetical protein
MPDIGIGASLAYDDGSGSTTIEGLKSLTIPALAIPSIDTTKLTNVDYWKTFMPGTIDGGTIGFAAEFKGSVYAPLFALATSRDTVTWTLSGPGDEESEQGKIGASFEFEAFITKLDGPIEAEAENIFNGEIKITGPITVTDDGESSE